MTKGTPPAAAGEAVDWFYKRLYVVQDACELWPFGASHGYGVFTVARKQYRVHRVACQAWNGPPPAGMDAAHGRLQRCVATTCFNGNHLSWKPPAGNAQDRKRDGTNLPGEQNPAAILTEIDVINIRREYREDKVRQQDLAHRYGLDQASISDILRGHTWSHLPGAYASRRRLTEAEVEALLEDHATGGHTGRALAAKYGVSTALVSLLINGQRRTWKRK
jgi:hypothetical protein